MQPPITNRRTALAAIAALPLVAAAIPPYDQFLAALDRYRDIKAAEATMLSGPHLADDWNDSIVGLLDAALDQLASVPSPGLDALALKVQILVAEFSGEIQPRHAFALADDARRIGGAA